MLLLHFPNLNFNPQMLETCLISTIVMFFSSTSCSTQFMNLLCKKGFARATDSIKTRATPVTFNQIKEMAQPCNVQRATCNVAGITFSWKLSSSLSPRTSRELCERGRIGQGVWQCSGTRDVVVLAA